MNTVGKVQWLARFDLEPLLSAILRNGLLLSIGLVSVSLCMQALGNAPGDQHLLQAESLPLLIWADLHRAGTSGFWPRFLLDLGVVVLLLTQYVRVAISMVYFAYVERSKKHVLFSSVVLVILTVVLLTEFG